MAEPAIKINRLTYGYEVTCSEHGSIGYRKRPRSASQLASRHYDVAHAECEFVHHPHEWHCTTHDITVTAGTDEPAYCPTRWEPITT